MAFLLDQDRFIPTLENVTSALVSSVESLRVDAVQMAHAFGKVRVRSFGEDMVMVVHQAISVDNPVESLSAVVEYIEKQLAIFFVFIDGFANLTPRCNVV